MSLYLKEVNRLKKNKIFKDCNFSDSSGTGKAYIINLIKKIEEMHFVERFQFVIIYINMELNIL